MGSDQRQPQSPRAHLVPFQLASDTLTGLPFQGLVHIQA